MPLQTFSKSLFGIISKGTRKSGNRIMVNIHAARQAYESNEIWNIAFVWSAQNLADSFTKPRMQSSLLNLLKTGRHDVECEQWILRSKPNIANF